MISVYRREVDQKRAHLGYHAVSGGKFLATFRDNPSVPYSGSKPLRIGPISFPDTSVKNCVITQKGAVLKYFLSLSLDTKVNDALLLHTTPFQLLIITNSIKIGYTYSVKLINMIHERNMTPFCVNVTKTFSTKPYNLITQLAIPTHEQLQRHRLKII